MGLKATGMAKENLAEAVHAPEFPCFGCTLFAGVVIREALLVKIIVDECLPQGDPTRKDVVLGLYILFLVRNHKGTLDHTFPLGPLFGARISGAGIGGRDIAASIPLLPIGV